MGIDPVEAERLKISYGLQEKTKLKNEIFQTLIPSLTDLVEQINKYLRYYQGHNFHDHLIQDNRLVNRILISGGGANLKGLPEFLSSELKIPVALANPWINVSTGKQKITKALSGEKALSFATAIGLALRGIKEKT